MRILSPAFKENEKIPSKYTCEGADVNPPFQISGVPEGTKSLALITDDYDSPGSPWMHWTVFNIDPDTKEIAENSVPEGATEGATSFGRSGYGGPCPKAGPKSHRYSFRLYALDIILGLTKTATKPDIEKAMAGHILASSELIGLYSLTSQ